MDLELTEEQQALRAAVRELCEARATTQRLRELEDDPVGYDVTFWRELAQMDLLGLTLPVAHGGSGMGTLEAVVVAEEFGRALAPSPHFVSCVVAGGLLATGGDADQRATWLPRIAAGDAIVTVAWHEADGSDGPTGIRVTGREDGADLVIDGTKIVVPYAAAADAFLVLARRGDAADDLDLVLVPADTPGIEVEHTPTLASDASCRVRFTGVRVASSARVGGAGAGWDTFVRGTMPALVVAGGWAVGAAERTLEMTADYAKQRVQFGVPIGNFQGIAHPIADIATEIAGGRALVYEAAWVQDQGLAATTLAAMAKRFTADVFRRATRVAHQTFGGIGFTTAIDVQLYFRRAKQHELLWFGPAYLDGVIAAAELDADEPFLGLAVGAGDPR